MNVSRRLFLGHLFAACAAPAIVRAGSLMPIKALDPILHAQNPWWINPCADDYAELTAITRLAFVPRLKAQLYKDEQAFLLRWNEHLYG